MNFKDLTADLVNKNNYEIQQRLERLIRTNYNFKNLDQANKKLILKLIKKYQREIRSGVRPSRSTIHEDKYYLYENRIKLGLTSTDLKQFNRLLDSFKS